MIESIEAPLGLGFEVPEEGLFGLHDGEFFLNALVREGVFRYAFRSWEDAMRSIGHLLSTYPLLGEARGRSFAPRPSSIEELRDTPLKGGSLVDGMLLVDERGNEIGRQYWR